MPNKVKETVVEAKLTAKEIALEIYNFYIEKLNPEKKYRYKAKALLHIGKLLKKFKKEQLLHSIDMYKKGKTGQFKNWIKSPAYFFNTSERGKDYYFFLDFMEMEEEDVIEPRKKIVVAEGEDILDQFFQ